MTPLQFEQTYGSDWSELETLLASVGRVRPVSSDERRSPARVAVLYRRACEHLALAQARSYPAHIVDRLARVTSAAHQRIYQQRDSGWWRVRHMVAVEFPGSVRAHAAYVAVSAATFVLPLIVMGLLVHARPELILSIVSGETAGSFEEMYAPASAAIGRSRDAGGDWMMFGHYIRNNIGVAFQCFAGGLFAGLGSLFYLAYNGLFIGALAGFLTSRGLSETFYSFVATHSSFELTAIVLSGAAGLRLGYAVTAPGRRTRAQALVAATPDSAVLLYGITTLLLIAAAIEAFWSSATWLPATVKYLAGAVGWVFVLAYFTLQGRHAR
jgi:uncharacterized membrane protein SpoIIM required for sporulation